MYIIQWLIIYIFISLLLFTVVKESPFYFNGSNVDDEEFNMNGQVKIERGVTNKTLRFNNSYIQMIHADDCLSNFDYCHNGLSIKFWLMTVGNLLFNSTQIVYSSMTSHESHGLTIYLTRNTSYYLLGLDIRKKISYKSTTVSVSSNVCSVVYIIRV